MVFLTNALAVVSATSILVLLVVFTVGALIERTAPAQRPQPISGLRVNVGYAFFAEFVRHQSDPIVGAVAWRSSAPSAAD